MITISTEKGLVRIACWQEILDRPDYRPRIDPKASPLNGVIGSYDFDDEVNCGLPCNQPHNRGFLVTTKDGLVTNIGKDCGERHFGLEFKSARASYERERERFERRESIRTAKNRVVALKAEVEELKAGGAAWVRPRLKALTEPGTLPEVIRAAVQRMVRTGNAQVLIDRPATAEEQEQREQNAGRRLARQFITEPIGNIAGLGALSPDRDLQVLIGTRLIAVLEDLERFDEETANDRALASMSKAANALDQTLDEAREAVRISGSSPCRRVAPR